MSRNTRNIEPIELLPGGGSSFQPLPKREESRPKRNFRRSGHLVDQILKYDYPNGSTQLSIYDKLTEETREEIEKEGIEISEVVEGIKLSPSETKVIDSLMLLLHSKSQNSEPKSEDFYTGNSKPELTQYLNDNTPIPKLSVTLYELTKEYKGGEAISGKDVDNVKNILYELNEKKFLIRYKEEIKKGKEKLTNEYEALRKIIEVDKATMSYEVSGVEEYKKTETIIQLHPIFRRQIDTKFILTPKDITKRTIIAYGNHNVSEITLRLRDYLMRELSSKHFTPEISQKKLYYLLSEKWMRESRKKKVKEYTEKAIETMKNLGLLLSYRIENNVKGEPKYIFELNEYWD